MSVQSDDGDDLIWKHLAVNMESRSRHCLQSMDERVHVTGNGNDAFILSECEWRHSSHFRSGPLFTGGAIRRYYSPLFRTKHF